MKRLLHGLAGDRQFLLVILLGNLACFLARVFVPLVLLGAMAALWWLL